MIADPPPRPEIALSPRDFARIADLARREWGLSLADTKRDLVQSRLSKRLRRIGCPDFTVYFDQIEADPHGPERAELISALTTNVTHFFREEHHFTTLAEVLRPRLDRLRHGERLRIWSAGCSAGQEPWSIAATLLDLLPEAAKLNIRILATDLDPAILARAEQALYPEDEAKGVPQRLQKLMFQSPAPPFRISETLRDMVRFAPLNLVADWPLRGPFDAIFCRNVAIYFDKPTQARLWQRLTALLAPGGLLCIGHSERITGPAADLLTPAGITTYRRPDPGQAKRTPA